ncbi:hypothetical protein D3C73_1232020 [compost metagenome]
MSYFIRNHLRSTFDSHLNRGTVINIQSQIVERLAYGLHIARFDGWQPRLEYAKTILRIMTEKYGVHIPCIHPEVRLGYAEGT